MCRAVFGVAALVPACVYLSTGFSYDATVIGSMLLGTALYLDIRAGEEPVTARQLIALLGVCAFGTVAKPAYSLILLLPLSLPSRRLGSRKRAWLARGLVLGLLAWCMGAMALPGVYDAVRAGDQRFADVDTAAQLRGLLARPWDILWVPLDYLRHNFVFTFLLGFAHWAYLGNQDTLNLIFPLLLVVVAPLAVCGEERRAAPLPGPGLRLGMGGIGLLVLCGLILAQYLVSSPVGGEIRGMQARYVLPVWILLALALSAPEVLRRRLGRVGPWLAGLTVGISFALDLWYALSWLKL